MLANPIASTSCAITLALALAVAAPVGGADAQQPSPTALATAKEVITVKGATALFDPLVPGVIEQAKSVFVRANPTLLKDLNEVRRGEPLPEWWPPSIEVDRARSGKRTGAATATREAERTARQDDLKKFIDDVYATANNGDHALGTGNGRKPLPFAKEDLRKAFLMRHPKYVVALATFEDDLQVLGVKIQPGRKRCDINEIANMMTRTL